MRFAVLSDTHYISKSTLHEGGAHSPRDVLRHEINRKVFDDLKKRMLKASEDLEFEEAARLRDLSESVISVTERQKMSDSRGIDRDIVALAREETDAVVQVFFVRDGRLIGREHYALTQLESDEISGLLSDFVKQFYAGTPFLPKEVLLPAAIEDEDIISRWLSDKKGEKVRLIVPERGQNSKLLKLAEENAALILKKDRERLRREEGRTIGAVREILGGLSVFGGKIPGTGDGMLAFVMAPGAFLCLGYLMVLFNKIASKNKGA